MFGMFLCRAQGQPELFQLYITPILQGRNHTMRKIALGLSCAAILATASTSFAAIGVIVNETFDYANTAAMSAVWAGFDGTLETELDYDLDGIPDEFGTFAFHPGGSINAMPLAAPVVASSTEWIKLSVDIFDDDTSLDPFFPLNPDNKRMSLGLRDTTVPSNIIELGMYNAVTDAHFAYRAILFGSAGDDPNWAGWDLGTEAVGADPAVPVNRFRGAGWHRYSVTITPDTLIFEFDLDRDGTIDGTDTYTIGVESGPIGFNELRFGGPSGITSGGGGVTFDNVVLEIIAAQTALVGDLNSDGFVGIDDLSIVLANWNQTVPPGDPLADPSGDGFVGIDDLNQVLGNWNAGTPPPAAGAAVPEPASLALLSLGAVAMLRRRR